MNNKSWPALLDYETWTANYYYDDGSEVRQRRIILSKAAPVYPAIALCQFPIKSETSVEVMPTIREFRHPEYARASRSRLDCPYHRCVHEKIHQVRWRNDLISRHLHWEYSQTEPCGF